MKNSTQIQSSFHLYIIMLFLIATTALISGCADPGDDGASGVDCGEYGSEHDGHCHCAEGFGFNGETCVALNEISEVCSGDVADEIQTDSAGETEHSHESHEVCLCPGNGTECPCEGELIANGASTYCIPPLHEDE